MSADSRYPAEYPACMMCGAASGEPCTIISGYPDQGEHPGDRRAYPHGNRAKPGQTGPREPFVAVKDEPNHYRGEPHTAECGIDCPLPPAQGD